MTLIERQLARTSPDYPARLRGESWAPDPLYVCGDCDLSRPAVAVVGTRAASRAGMIAATELCRDLCGLGVVVISGGQTGTDAAAHAGALAAGGTTWSILASGLDAPYPERNRPLFDAIVGAGGALISVSPAGTPPRRFAFAKRNRVLCALADAVVVIEGAGRSGALAIAEAARGLSRPVCARPGSPGTEALLASGAAIVESAADVMAAIAGHGRRPVIDLPDPDSDEGILLAALSATVPRASDELGERAGVSPRRALRALTGLELSGLAVLAGPGAYLRSRTADEIASDS